MAAPAVIERLSEGFYFWKNQKFGISLSNGYAVEICTGPKDYCEKFDPNKAETVPLVTTVWHSTDCQLKVYRNGTDITQEFLREYGQELQLEDMNFRPQNLFHILNCLSLIDKA